MGVKRKLIGIVGALVFAMAGTFLVLNSRGDQSSKTIARAQVPMLVATQKLAAGTSVDKLLNESAGLLTVSLVNVEDKNVDALAALADLDRHKGLVLSSEVAPNTPLLTNSFVDRGSLSLAAGGVDVPPDMLQLSFSLEPQRVLGGSLRAGDRVAVIVSVAEGERTHIVAQKALIANVQLSNLANAGDAVPTENGAPGVVGNYMVTLALSAPDVERVTNGLEFGKLWLAKQPVTATGEGSKVWDIPQTLEDLVTSYAASEK